MNLVHLVDDDASFRAATGRLLRLHGYATAEYASAERFLEHLSEGTEPGCILLDLNMPGLSGAELQERLARIGSPLPIVFLTGHGDIPSTVRVIKAGAENVLTKPVSGAALLESIERAFERYRANEIDQGWLRKREALLGTLSPREREVFDFVVRGKLNKETAFVLGISERTVKAHRQRVFEKLGARSVTDLVSLAERLGLLRQRETTG